MSATTGSQTSSPAAPQHGAGGGVAAGGGGSEADCRGGATGVLTAEGREKAGDGPKGLKKLEVLRVQAFGPQ